MSPEEDQIKTIHRTMLDPKPLRQISVIVCSHNRADLLPGIIAQLRAQDYAADAFEIVVVDNCSTDHTADVVERLLAEPGVCLRYVVESRPGITFARNRGAEIARYPYLAFLDDDCSVGPCWLSQLVSGFDLDARVAAVAGRVVLDWDKHEKPYWLGIESERWLAAYSFPGSQPRLLDNPVYVIEGNMALARNAWKAAGGFLGMDQFGSQHMAAEEIVYLLKQIERIGGKVAYVPGGVVFHHVGRRTLQWFLKRAYWHGVSDGILNYLIFRRSVLSAAHHTFLEIAAMIIFFCFSVYYFIRLDIATAIYHQLRAIARLGKILCEMRIVGDWPRVRSWAASHPWAN
jgi:glucosyl-dolichyl phosphate glucuronosyltransferase